MFSYCTEPDTLGTFRWFSCYLTTGVHFSFYWSFAKVLLLLAITAPVALGFGFVGAMADAGRNAAIVRAIVALAHSLELEVVAEGVETRAQLDLLTELNCDYVQGFLIGKPCPERDLPALLNYSG